MGKYMFSATYTKDGAAGLLADGGTSRQAAVGSLVESVGGTLEAFYFMFGKQDIVAIVDLPDEETATALALTIGASGAVSLRTNVLLTADQVDAAAAKTVAYRSPGAS